VRSSKCPVCLTYCEIQTAACDYSSGEIVAVWAPQWRYQRSYRRGPGGLVRVVTSDGEVRFIQMQGEGK